MKTICFNIAKALVLTLFSFSATHAASPASKALSDNNPTPSPATVVQKTTRETDSGQSVLERFRSYSGQRTPASLSALFKTQMPASISQQPEIALSDGVTVVTIEAALTASNGTGPNFACNGAQLISVKLINGGIWAIAALPDKNTWKASLLILTKSVSLEVPLTVAPMLPAETDLSEQGFITFLGSSKEPGSQPLQDLNNDGKHDYLDDYIFTANYLVNQRTTAAIPGPSQDSDVQDSITIPKADEQPPLDRAAPDPAPGETPGSGPGIGQASGPAIKPETAPALRDPASRNERARKMQELLKRPVQ